MASPYGGSASCLRLYEIRICLDLALHTYPGATNARVHLPFRVIPSLTSRNWVGVPRRTLLSKSRLVGTRTWWYWNINQLSIDYACRPRLRSRLTLGGRAFPRKPWTFGGGDSHSTLATHTGILASAASTAGLRRCFSGCSTLPYRSHPLDVDVVTRKRQSIDGIPQLRRCALAPLHFPRRTTRPVSYYALFQGMAASKPTSWLFLRSHLVSHLAHT